MKISRLRLIVKQLRKQLLTISLPHGIVDSMVAQHIFMTPAQVAEKFGVNINTVYSWVRRGKVTAARYGRDLMIPLSDIQKHLKKTGV